MSPTTSFGVRCQEPKKQDPPKEQPKPASGQDLLDAEKEKLRMKDVEEWKTLKVKSLDDVIDVMKTTAPIELPASLSDDDRKKMADLLKEGKEAGGARAGRALRKLEKMGWPAMVFMINHLREINYKDTDESMWGNQVNQSLTNITMGVNAGYVPPTLGEAMDPRMAQYNAMTVKVWLDSVRTQWPTQEKFDAFIARRKEKKDAELEGREIPTRQGKEKEKEKEKEAPKPK